MTPAAADARAFAITAHAAQQYGDKPYHMHLEEVVRVLADFGFSGVFEVAGWLHDVVEDTNVDIAEIRARFGDEVASLVDAVTGLGVTRRERNARIFAGLERCPYAAVIKLADRIANVEASKPGSDHRRRYMREAPAFARMMEGHVPVGMLQRLEHALSERE